ncbi:hypothetical protein CEXT_758521 [Caerostris extrusa]|uniref:Uncharacterized protein n=1 Tax=Caerostris extrusa TaxID=172846 RepID=A0AAV4SWS4_CAEEX|nr:hypothetical protein CEXT_758521 [Caerostris extrusa]
MSRSKNLLGLSGEDRVFVKEIERFLQEPNNPVLINLLQQQSNSSRCVQDLNYVLDSVQKHYWARRMVDAYGKPESGILRGISNGLASLTNAWMRMLPPWKTQTREIFMVNIALLK